MTTAIAGATATSVDDIPFNPHKRDYKKAGIIVAFCVIPVTLLVVFTYWPFIQMCGYSFYKMKYIGTPRFIGMKNYIDIFTRPELLATLKLSLYFIFKFFYTRGYVLDTVLQWCGFTQDTLPYWLRDQSINNWSLVASSIWRYLGSTLILFIGAIMSIDSSLYEAAEIDGANKWQQFKHIILPGIQTILVLNIILSITGSLSAFEGPYVITSGANGTGTYMVQMDKIAHTDQKVGLASAMAVILLIIIIICTLLQKIVMGFLFRDADDGTAKARKQAKKADKARRRAMKAANKVQAGKAPLFKNGKVSA